MRDSIKPEEQYFQSGILFSHLHLDWVLRRAQGHAFWNHPSGIRWVEGCFNDGVRCGRWREFDANGSVLSVTDFGEREYVKEEGTMPTLEGRDLSPESLVLLCEEYGFRHWLWFPDRPPAELAAWWSEMPSVEQWSAGPQSLPGTLVEVSDDVAMWNALFDTKRHWYLHLHEEDDSEMRSPEGELFHHRAWAMAQTHWLC